jgi:hypothetical protein
MRFELLTKKSHSKPAAEADDDSVEKPGEPPIEEVVAVPEP